MPDMPHARHAYFTTYTGVRLPLKFVNPLEEHETRNRNTYFCAYYDEADRLVGCRKMVYGEVELTHRYEYLPDGSLRRAEITEADDAPRELLFDPAGG